MGRRISHDSGHVAESVEALKEDLSHFKKDVLELVQGLAEVGKNKGNELTGRVREEVSHRVDQMRKGLEKVRDSGESSLHSVERTIERHPLMSVACALGMGVLISRFFRR